MFHSHILSYNEVGDTVLYLSVHVSWGDNHKQESKGKGVFGSSGPRHRSRQPAVCAKDCWEREDNSCRGQAEGSRGPGRGQGMG